MDDARIATARYSDGHHKNLWMTFSDTNARRNPLPDQGMQRGRRVGKKDIDGNYRNPIHTAINRRTGETRMCACNRIEDHWDSVHGTWQDTHPTLF